MSTFNPPGVEYPTMTEPREGEWPYWVAGEVTWRNGREAGAHAAGLVSASPEKCGLVEVPTAYADGAALAMIAASLAVESYSSSETTVTFRVRASWMIWTPRLPE